MSNDFYTQYKIELLEKHSTSRELYQVLEKATEEFHWVTNDDSLFVDETPLGTGHEIETVVSLLSDLAQYHLLVRCDAEIPDDLAYITPFIVPVEIDEDDEGLDESILEALSRNVEEAA